MHQPRSQRILVAAERVAGAALATRASPVVGQTTTVDRRRSQVDDAPTQVAHAGVRRALVEGAHTATTIEGDAREGD